MEIVLHCSPRFISTVNCSRFKAINHPTPPPGWDSTPAGSLVFPSPKDEKKGGCLWVSSSLKPNLGILFKGPLAGSRIYKSQGAVPCLFPLCWLPNECLFCGAFLRFRGMGEEVAKEESRCPSAPYCDQTVRDALAECLRFSGRMLSLSGLKWDTAEDEIHTRST